MPECIGQATYSVGILEGGGDDESEQVVVGSKVTIPASETGHIYWTEEYRFFMHRCDIINSDVTFINYKNAPPFSGFNRHWSLYDAMYHSNYVASKLEVWKTQGTAKLKVNTFDLGFICTVGSKFLKVESGVPRKCWLEWEFHFNNRGSLLAI